jgi:tetratricopeptide (TPR) repeat protein
MARRHFESGAAYLQESDYGNALRAFEKAYELSKRPAILVNIATVHERQGNLQPAVDVLEKYLELEPQGEHATTVKLRLANLKKRLEEAPQSTPAGEASPAAAPTPAPRSNEPSPAPTPTPRPAPAADSQPNRIPAYIFLGLGAAAAGGAVVTGLLARGEYNDAEDSINGCSPVCTDDQLQSGRTLAVVSTVLTGVSVVSVAVGVVLLLSGDGPTEQPAAGLPAVRITAVRDAAGASATWRF